MERLPTSKNWAHLARRHQQAFEAANRRLNRLEEQLRRELEQTKGIDQRGKIAYRIGLRIEAAIKHRDHHEICHIGAKTLADGTCRASETAPPGRGKNRRRRR